jgi:hemolysin activation/secretion protein
MIITWQVPTKKLNLAILLIQGLLLFGCGDRVLAINLSNSLLFSQVPNPITPRQREQPIPIPKPIPEAPLELPTTPNSPLQQRPVIPGNITVKKFEFEGNTAFSDEELGKAVKNYINKPIAFTELLQVEEIIKNKYTSGCQSETAEQPCYLNSGAYIPANQVFVKEGAIVKVQVLEGEIEEIEVTGTHRLNPDYIRSRIQGGISKPLNREKLLEKLQLLKLNPLIENLSAELAAGARPNQSLLTIKVTEADSFSTELFTDNGRVPSVGSWRRGINISEGNLLGFGDRLSGEYTNTDGSNALDFSYALPLNGSNSTMSLAGGISDTEVVEPPFDRIDIQGDSFYFELGFRQPLWETPTEEFALGLTASRQESNTEIMGENFALAPGADNNGETRISSLLFFQDYTHRNFQEVFAMRSQFNLGIDVFDATVNDDPLPDSRFFAWRGQGQYVRRLGQNSLMVLRSDLQFSTTNLVPLEQFSVGGLQSVRGYRQDALLTDNGFFTSAEVRLPILTVEKVQGVLQVAPFVDFGIGWNNGNTPDPEENILFGMGLGLQWQMGDNFTARFDWGIPLTDVKNRERTLQEDGVYFSVNYSPF